MPGVLLVESMAQTSGIACALYSNEQKKVFLKSDEVYFLSRICDIKFKYPVLPGDTLIIKSKIVQYFHPSFKVEAVCKVSDKVVAKGELVLTKQGGGVI